MGDQSPERSIWSIEDSIGAKNWTVNTTWGASWGTRKDPDDATKGIDNSLSLERLRQEMQNGDFDAYNDLNLFGAIRDGLALLEHRQAADHEMIIRFEQRLLHMESQKRARDKQLLMMFDVLGDMISDPVACQFLAIIRETVIAETAE